MSPRRASHLVNAMAGVLLIAACSGSSATPTAPVPSTPAGGGGGVPTLPAGGGGTGTECAGIPTLDPAASAAPSFSADSTLTAKFPTTIDGQPVTGALSVQYLSALCQEGGQTAVDTYTQAFAAAGITFATMSVGSFQATVDGAPVTVNALRTPGQDSSKIVSSYAMLAQQLGGTTFTGSMSPGSVGGKNVTVATDPSTESVAYLYTTGDTIFVVGSVTADEAGKVLAALP